MPFNPEVQQLIHQVETLSGRPVYVAEESGMSLRATLVPARKGAAAHLVRYKPGSSSLDYLVANQLVYLLRTFSCPEEDRWEVAAIPSEQDAGIRTMGLTDFQDAFARGMIGQIVTQIRTYSIGFRVDAWIRSNLPSLHAEQEAEIRSQLSENERALNPEIRKKFPKPLVDTNSIMNTVFAICWGRLLGEPRFEIPYVAMGYRAKATGLIQVLEEVPDDPTSDRLLVERWATLLGLSDAFHFNPYSLD